MAGAGGLGGPADRVQTADLRGGKDRRLQIGCYSPAATP